ncbi:MAG: SAM-dependent chlorinase/fluorinase [Actinomycetota bacterium]|nr:SAM-dependent chlorinase/fluorinase [Actinomycetota bacterium]
MTRPILFLTDYGLEGEYVGLCHTVIARIAPEARVIDVTHTIPRHGIRAGAIALANAVRFAPEDAVWLAVVDPGVGTERRGVAVETAGGWLVGPDNGLLSLAWEPLAGLRRSFEIEDSVAPWRTSRTFHGRDLFAPAAARLAAGEDPAAFAHPIDPATLATLEPPAPAVRVEALVVEVIDVDRFGNLRLGATPADLVEADLGERRDLWARCGDQVVGLSRGETFADVPEGDYVLLVDSSGWLAIARNASDAAAGLAATVGDAVVVSAEEVG